MPYSFFLFMIFNIFFGISAFISDDIPIVISTWNFDKAVAKAWSTLESTNSALDSIEAGCTACEILQCDGTVGYGGSPDENGETTLDAMIMDGTSMNVGAVASLRRIKNAISVARAVLDKTEHSILVGGSATEFAKEMGFKEESLTTEKSTDIWLNWKKNSCQPNFWKNVRPNPRESCGPYSPAWDPTNNIKPIHKFDKRNHDTIGMIVIDEKGNIAAGTSSNGAHYKIPGRVGDSPIPGSGSYADSSVGGAAATGDGDVMLRFLPSFLAVEEMRTGSSPKHAAMKAVRRIYKFYPNFSGAVIAVNKTGAYGAACAGIDSFPYSVRSKNMKKVEIVSVQCLTNKEQPSILFV